MKIRELTKFLNFITGNKLGGISLSPFAIYLNKKYLKNKKIINHESIHWKQQMELLIIFFYVLYVFEYFVRIFTNGGDPYRNISFEREAYANEHNPEYLKTRKRFAWIKYLKK